MSCKPIQGSNSHDDPGQQYYTIKYDLQNDAIWCAQKLRSASLIFRTKINELLRNFAGGCKMTCTYTVGENRNWI